MPFKNGKTEEPIAKSKGASLVKLLWLIVIIGLGYGTLQIFGGLASESRQSIKLQEIKQNTVQVVEDIEKEVEVVVEGDVDKEVDKEVENNNELASGEDIQVNDSGSYLGNWKDKMKQNFTGEEIKTNEAAEEKPSRIETPKKVISDEDSSLLLAIRSLDEEGTALLEAIRDSSIEYMNGDISKGKYTLRLKSIELQMDRNTQGFHNIEEEAYSTPSYNVLLNYVWMKKESLDLIVAELRITSTDNVAIVFNDYVDIHNELTIETDKEFVHQLKQIGYEAEIINGVIEYR